MRSIIFILAALLPLTAHAQLTADIKAAWHFDEASGNALDASGNSHDLTDNNTVTAGTGKINGARDFEADNSEWFHRTDHADLSAGDVDFSFFAWINIESLSAIRQIGGKFLTGGNQREWRLQVNTSGTLNLAVSADGGSTLTQVNWGSNLSTATWYFVACGHNATANDIWVSVNAGTPVTTSHSTGVFDGTADFTIGARGAGTEPFDGLIDEAAFFKRDIRSDLATFYNSGNGRAYPFSSPVPVIIQIINHSASHLHRSRRLPVESVFTLAP